MHNEYFCHYEPHNDAPSVSVHRCCAPPSSKPFGLNEGRNATIENRGGEKIREKLRTHRKTHRQTDIATQLPLRNVSSLVCDAGGLPHCFHVFGL